MRRLCRVGNSVYSYILSEMPGNPDIAVLHGLYLCEGQGGENTKGLGKRLDILKDLGYSAVMVTVDKTNEKEKHSLRGNNVSYVNTFKSRRTGHEVTVYFKDLGVG